MTRYRWLDVNWPLPMRSLALRMKERGFDSLSSHGFVVDKIREDFIEARYIEKVNYTDTVVDPFGNESFFERIEYRESSFRVSEASPGLELMNSPRSLQALLNRLSEISDFQASIVPLEVNVLAWTKELTDIWKVDSILDSMQISRLHLDSGIYAKVLISGECDVREASKRLTEERNYTLEKVRLRIVGKPKGTIILSSAGTVTISFDDVSDDLLFFLRVSLDAVMNQKSAFS
ncbi:MAG: hypothetical protein Q7U27_28820 [Pseudomonas sp.]|uniref:hypothetical protein n=1 Tax=Pseudomonas sp. TaxID=306 RepID=UPI0027169D92|nr:hypothetical protein [Pseudomonas sp.]MDO9332714.1 hypothetical protein [Pseudomonas sp.]